MAYNSVTKEQWSRLRQGIRHRGITTFFQRWSRMLAAADLKMTARCKGLWKTKITCVVNLLSDRTSCSFVVYRSRKDCWVTFPLLLKNRSRNGKLQERKSCQFGTSETTTVFDLWKQISTFRSFPEPLCVVWYMTLCQSFTSPPPPNKSRRRPCWQFYFAGRCFWMATLLVSKLRYLSKLYSHLVYVQK